MVRTNKSKQVIVVRKDLRNKKGEKIRTGKIVSQGAHASMAALFNHQWNWWIVLMWNVLTNSALRNWLFGIFTKITVSVDSEQELVEIYNKAKSKGLLCSLITDAGLTEFDKPTITCCAIGPCWSDEVDEITKKLPLL